MKKESAKIIELVKRSIRFDDGRVDHSLVCKYAKDEKMIESMKPGQTMAVQVSKAFGENFIQTFKAMHIAIRFAFENRPDGVLEESRGQSQRHLFWAFRNWVKLKIGWVDIDRVMQDDGSVKENMEIRHLTMADIGDIETLQDLFARVIPILSEFVGYSDPLDFEAALAQQKLTRAGGRDD